jgi:cytochrome c biogenesis protein CcmG/thiol:disulfide interchange protein DsbE
MPRARFALLLTIAAGSVFLVMLAVLGVALARGVGGATEGRSEAAITTAPAFTLTTFDGQAFDFARRNEERPVFIYFWASWCVPCQAEAPVIERLWAEYRDRGYVFLGVNMWDQPEDARRFVGEYRLTFPVVADEARSVYVEYGVQGLPTAFFVAPGGAVRAQFTGPLDERTLRGLLDEIAPGRS